MSENEKLGHSPERARETLAKIRARIGSSRHLTVACRNCGEVAGYVENHEHSSQSVAFPCPFCAREVIG